MSEIIYGLSHIENNEKVYFYIGHTNRPSAKRLYEHRNLTGRPGNKAGQYLRYDYSRALDALGISWDMDILSTVPDGIYLGDYEFEYIIKYLIAGHPLQNQKHGDKLNIAGDEELKSMISCGVRTAADVKKFREKKEAETEANKIARQLKQAAKLKEEADKLEAKRIYDAKLTERQRIREAERIENTRLQNIQNSIILAKRLQDEKIKKEREIARDIELKKWRAIQEKAWAAQQVAKLEELQKFVPKPVVSVEIPKSAPIIAEMEWDDFFIEEKQETIKIISAKKSTPSKWLLDHVKRL
jgi:hypothetical protein